MKVYLSFEAKKEWNYGCEPDVTLEITAHQNEAHAKAESDVYLPIDIESIPKEWEIKMPHYPNTPARYSDWYAKNSRWHNVVRLALGKEKLLTPRQMNNPKRNRWK